MAHIDAEGIDHPKKGTPTDIPLIYQPGRYVKMFQKRLQSISGRNGIMIGEIVSLDIDVRLPAYQFHQIIKIRHGVPYSREITGNP
jgi:hypothetical protein